MVINWNSVDFDDIRLALGDSYTLDLVLEHDTTCSETLLECLDLDDIECIAEQYKHALIASERELSERFDKMLEELDELTKLRLINDEIALNECFNNFTDAGCSDMLLHPTQLDNYTYGGAYC